jgi:hypothetical protein
MLIAGRYRLLGRHKEDCKNFQEVRGLNARSLCSLGTADAVEIIVVSLLAEKALLFYANLALIVA